MQAYQLTGREEFRQTAEDIFGFVSQVMKAPEEGFYSALDSETEGVEGQYYLWTEEEIRQVLGKQADLFLKVYALAPMPEGDAGSSTSPAPWKNPPRVGEFLRLP